MKPERLASIRSQVNFGARIDPKAGKDLIDEIDTLTEYRVWYDEAICASNELGYAGMSAADVIKHQAEELASLKAKGVV